MLNIDVLTVGNEFKNSDVDVYKVVSNFGDKKKIYIELELVEPVEEIIKQEPIL